MRVGENTLADVYDAIVDHHQDNVSNIAIFRKQGRKVEELCPLSAYLNALGFRGAPASEDSYPAYDIFYEVNNYSNSDFIGLGKTVLK